MTTKLPHLANLAFMTLQARIRQDVNMKIDTHELYEIVSKLALEVNY